MATVEYKDIYCGSTSYKADACTAKKPSILHLDPSKGSTYYIGNPDFKLDLSNMGENIEVRGYYNTEGYSNNMAGYPTKETILMIFSESKLVHKFIVGGHQELKNSIIDGADSDSLIKGLTTIINGETYYNALCGNLDRKLQCLPVTIKKAVQLTNFHICDLPSSEDGLTIIPNSGSDKFLINLSHLDYIDSQESTDLQNGGSLLKAQNIAGQTFYTVQVDSLNPSEVESRVSMDDSTSYICPNLEATGVCTLDTDV